MSAAPEWSQAILLRHQDIREHQVDGMHLTTGHLGSMPRLVDLVLCPFKYGSQVLCISSSSITRIVVCAFLPCGRFLHGRWEEANGFRKRVPEYALQNSCRLACPALGARGWDLVEVYR